MIDFITNNIDIAITLIIAPIITWFVSKRKYQARDLDSKDIEIIRSNLQLYQTMVDDIDMRTKRKINELEDEIDSLEKENKRLKSLLDE